MAAVKTTAKMEDLFMAVSFQALRAVFEPLFHELDAGMGGNLSGKRESSGLFRKTGKTARNLFEKRGKAGYFY